MIKTLLALAAIALYVLHQDVWNWRAVHPLLFGFLPIGLTYHAVFTLACSLFMAALVRWAWPTKLERDAEDSGQ
jgi:hypothetical protein